MNAAAPPVSRSTPTRFRCVSPTTDVARWRRAAQMPDIRLASRLTCGRRRGGRGPSHCPRPPRRPTSLGRNGDWARSGDTRPEDGAKEGRRGQTLSGYPGTGSRESSVHGVAGFVEVGPGRSGRVHPTARSKDDEQSPSRRRHARPSGNPRRDRPHPRSHLDHHAGCARRRSRRGQCSTGGQPRRRDRRRVVQAEPGVRAERHREDHQDRRAGPLYGWLCTRRHRDLELDQHVHRGPERGRRGGRPRRDDLQVRGGPRRHARHAACAGHVCVPEAGRGWRRHHHVGIRKREPVRARPDG